jgi:hypothetical protein
MQTTSMAKEDALLFYCSLLAFFRYFRVHGLSRYGAISLIQRTAAVSAHCIYALISVVEYRVSTSYQDLSYRILTA